MNNYNVFGDFTYSDFLRQFWRPLRKSDFQDETWSYYPVSVGQGVGVGWLCGGGWVWVRVEKEQEFNLQD